MGTVTRLRTAALLDRKDVVDNPGLSTFSHRDCDQPVQPFIFRRCRFKKRSGTEIIARSRNDLSSGYSIPNFGLDVVDTWVTHKNKGAIIGAKCDSGVYPRDPVAAS